MSISSAWRTPFTSMPFLYPQAVVQRTFRREQSTARRTTKRLRVRPDRSMFEAVPSSHRNDHLIINPPSSAPSPYHTPAAFLPRDDPRRALLSQTFSHYNPYQNSERRLPPAIAKPAAKKYHLKEEDFEEIRRLRSEDPWTWTTVQLAKKFETSNLFISMVAHASEKKLKYDAKQLEAKKDRWGPKRRAAREERAKRRALWGMDK